MNYNELSRVVSHALRHEPWIYELELDKEGWVTLSELLASLRLVNKEWITLEESDLVTMIQLSSKKRHEIKDAKIRALYGHSTPHKLIKELSLPPRVLYHGTAPENIGIILQEGLRPMNRHYVHLSIDKNMAIQVGSRKSSQPVIVCVRAFEANQSGVCFYKGNEHVWLADNIPSMYIEID